MHRFLDFHFTPYLVHLLYDECFWPVTNVCDLFSIFHWHILRTLVLHLLHLLFLQDQRVLDFGESAARLLTLLCLFDRLQELDCSRWPKSWHLVLFGSQRCRSAGCDDFGLEALVGSLGLLP